jgi:hypothetical protein
MEESISRKHDGVHRSLCIAMYSKEQYMCLTEETSRDGLHYTMLLDSFPNLCSPLDTLIMDVRLN